MASKLIQVECPGCLKRLTIDTEKGVVVRVGEDVIDNEPSLIDKMYPGLNPDTTKEGG